MTEFKKERKKKKIGQGTNEPTDGNVTLEEEGFGGVVVQTA